MNDALREKLKNLPAQPGCYLMKDSAGTIIYVGKAVNLRNRVRSYFHGQHDPKTELLVANIVDLETVVVQSEQEALILEANLIKEHRPYYNILMRDDKHYPYLRLTLDEDYPRLLVARRARPDGSKYFGPYPDAGAMHRAVELIRGIFPLRTCSGRSFRPGQRACLNAHINRCLAPCEGRISREEYREMVEEVSRFLLGKSRGLRQREQELMDQAADELRFEDAARHRDALRALEQVQRQQQLDLSTGVGNYDILAAISASEAGDPANDVGVIQVFFIRNGITVSRAHFFARDPGLGAAGLLRFFISDYYGGGQLLPSALYCNVLPAEAEALGQMLAGQCGHKVAISVPQRGDKRRLLGLVTENARLALEEQINSRQRQEERSNAALEELRQVLTLPVTPCRIECYDISHVQGAHMVGSMVVFKNGVAAPKLYRRFKIKTLDGSNDFAALQEVVERRWRRGLEERAAGKTDGFAEFPDLMVIDGGKGQLSAVGERLAQLGADRTALISLAKQEEEIFLPGESLSLRLPADSGALQLLQRLRDEAHRFAISFHRQLRGKGQTRSLLDDAPGIGPERRKSLLKTFGSLKQIRQASQEELAAAPKMNRPAAARLYAFLHPPAAGEGAVEAETIEGEA